MSDKNDLALARDEMLAVLDEKFANMPEWRAFRAMDKALTAMDEGSALKRKTSSPRVIRRRPSEGPTYVDLALEAVAAKGVPVPTTDLIRFIAPKRNLDAESEKTRINIQSGLSRDKRIKSVPWAGGRAWWFADRKVPNTNSAGPGASP
jgi:hypothetical protein